MSEKDTTFNSTKRQDRVLPEDSFGDWRWREALSELMVPIIGSLYRDGVQILMYGPVSYTHLTLPTILLV